MSAPSSTKSVLISLINDVEIISKELFEIMGTSKQKNEQDHRPADTSELLDLLVQKDAEIQEALLLANKQADVQKKMDALKSEVDKRDADIKQLQQNLKDAENILSTAIYQGKIKLESISKSQKHPIASEELIKFSHRISVSNSVAAPGNWVPGDSRRPYPTDIEMRMGLLARLNDLPHGQLLQSQTSFDGTLSANRPPSQIESASAMQQGTYMTSWPSTYEHSSSINMGMAGQGSAHMDSRHKDSEDVELMSSDSSSSSSSDE